MNREESLRKIKQELPENVCLVAVSKTKSVEEIRQLYDLGQRVFAENKAQEMREKQEELPQDIQWHFIGHLQTNKIKQIVPFVSMIQSIDSFKLLLEVDKETRKLGRRVDCLLQFHIAREDSKYGFKLDEVEALLENLKAQVFEGVQIRGVMGMATNTDNQDQISREFRGLKRMFLFLKEGYFRNQKEFSVISMGMSSDFQIAVKEGSTMVRLGSSLFGQRVYAE